MPTHKIFNSETKEYWIIFTQGSHLISKFLKKNYSHIYIVTRDKFNWIVLNPMRYYLDVEIPAVKVMDDLPRLIRSPLDSVIKINFYDHKPEKQFKYFGLMNCVSHVLYILGLRLNVFTPFGLYKKLLRLSQREMARYGIKSIKFIA